MCYRNSLVFKCDCEHAEDSGDGGSVAPLCDVPDVQRSQTIPDSSKNIFQVDRIQSGAWSEFADRSANIIPVFIVCGQRAERSPDGSRNILQFGHSLVRAEGNGEIGP
jgi:hypothetical protein